MEPVEMSVASEAKKLMGCDSEYMTDAHVWLCVKRHKKTGKVMDRFRVHGGLVPILKQYPNEYTLSYLFKEATREESA